MTPFSACRAGWMLALALAGAPSVVPAQDASPAQLAPADATSFAAEFDQAQSFTRRRMWKSAHAAWLDLLRKHAGATYARPHLPEIRELVRKCAFWQVTREPDAKSCISGKLISYEAASGRIRIQYTPDTLGDFESMEPLLVHPMHFSGPYTLELKGQAATLARATLLVGLEGSRYCALVVGSRLKGTNEYTAPQLLEVDGQEVKLIASGQLDEYPPLEPIVVVASVAPRILNFKYDGRQTLNVDWTGRTLGGFGLSAEAGFTELVVTGNVDPGWIDGRIDAKVQAERAAFDAQWVVPAEFAAWPAPRPSETRSQVIRRLFGDIQVLEQATPAQQRLIERISAARLLGGSADVIDEVLKFGDDRLPQAARDLVLALCYLDIERPAQALAHLDARAKLVPLDFTLSYLRAMLLSQVERREEALALLERLAEEERERQLVTELRAGLLLVANRIDEARAVLDRGLEQVGPTTELEALRSQLAKATVGPAWRHALTQASPNFVVSSDVDTATARLASRTLEDAWTDCQRVLGVVARPAKPTPAFVFSGEASYLDYIQGISDDGHENTLGLYSRSAHQILAWNPAKRSELLLTLRHECVHLHMDLALGEVPRWYAEGLADYVAACRQDEGGWTESGLHPMRLARLRRETALIELRSFLRLDDTQFMSDAGLHYAEAWAFVHFLRTGRNEAALGFERRLVTELKGRTDARSAVERALAGVDLKALEEAFLEYLSKLLLDR